MTSLFITPTPLRSKVVIPPSKSHTQRALLLGLRASTPSTIKNPLNSPDTLAMAQALEAFGAHIDYYEDRWVVTPSFSPPTKMIDAGNSGQVFRFIAAMAACHSTPCHITGDHSILTNRPITPLFNALTQLGAQCQINPDSFTIKGPIHPGHCVLDGKDSQPISALLMATAFLQKETEIKVENPKETPWIDLTLDWLKRLGATITHDNYTHYKVKGSLTYPGFTTTIPADFSTAAFPIAAALIGQTKMDIIGLDPNDCQGDKALIPLLQSMGAHITWNDQTLTVYPSTLEGRVIDVNPFIDALPILSVIGCFAKGKTILTNGAIARHKESDRISAICQELKKMGAKIEELPDGLIIEQSPLTGAFLNTHQDHRIALALFVAALNAKAPSTLDNTCCIAKTFPHFQGALCELDSIRV